MRNISDIGSGSSSHVNLTIINTSSIGSAMTNLAFSSYQAGKSAVNRFTEFIHFEYEAEGVRAFSIHPGVSSYFCIRGLLSSHADHDVPGGVATKLATSTLPESMHQYLTDTPELAAGYVLWLATSGSKVDFLRGRYSSADWDVDELLARQNEIVKGNLLWTRVVGQEQVHV
jgi:NAD(P)-dependent dehydrogenase (short-subunit alcohol dehydrogenase family)